MSIKKMYFLKMFVMSYSVFSVYERDKNKIA